MKQEFEEVAIPHPLMVGTSAVKINYFSSLLIFVKK
jgi:hypothetical protein